MHSRITDRILAVTLAVLFAGFLYTIRNSFEQRIIEKGDSAPSFAITTDSGKKITRSEFGGKLLILNFWATWCPPCIEELPSLSDFASSVKDSGIVVLAVSIDKNEKVYRQFLQRNRVGFETARDPEANIAADYGTFKWPETYVINSDGKVLEKYISNRNWTDPTLMASIKAML